MRIIYQDLLRFLVDQPSIEELSQSLFQLGHEHEIDKDTFDMEFTPNRGDCLSLRGLSRDLNVFYGNTPEQEFFSENIKKLDISFQNLSHIDCPKISFLQLEIKNKSSHYKPYLENYFKKLKINKTNFFTDISNYLSYEQGQPTHCYDNSKINGTLSFANEHCSNKFETLLGSEINLKGKNCVFYQNNKIINLAGIMGGIKTACSKNTEAVLVECAYFRPESIIGKSIQYNLVSDAAHKFERGVDIHRQEYILRRFIQIVSDHADIVEISMTTYDETTSNNSKINGLEIDVDTINKILGTDITESEYLNYLKKLNFTISTKIEPPSFRHDISTQNDLAEEIARVIGYDNIKSSSISLKLKKNKTDNKIRKLKKYLTEKGFTEVINFPFVSSNSENSIEIDNPLDSNKSFLRTDLKNNLISNLLYNERRQKDSIKLFEISDIYTKNADDINSSCFVGLIASGRAGHNHQEFSKKIDENYLKQKLNKFANNSNINILEIPREKLNTKSKNKIFYTEFNVNKIEDNLFDSLLDLPEINTEFKKYKNISDFPSSTRDLSFSISNISNVKKVLNYFEHISEESLQKCFIFDFYKNEKQNEVKIGYRLIFQSNHKTLNDNEVNEVIKKLIKPVLLLDGVSIPGM